MKIAEKLSFLPQAAISVLYPQACAMCAASVEFSIFGAACEQCWRETNVFDGDEAICVKCGAVLSFQAKSAGFENTRCHRCDESSFTAARAVGIYEGALRVHVLQLKEKPFVPAHLKNLLFRAQQKPPLNRAAKIIPVPLHPRRERERGFNQAALLASALSRKSKLPILENVLERTVQTQIHRVGMDERARQESVAGAFTIKNPFLVENEKILLIDDVFTTGATVSACAELLKKAGANEVFVLTLARVK